MKHIRWIVDQISRARLTKVTGMHLISVLPFPIESTSMITSEITDVNTAVSEVSTGRDVITALSSHAVIDDCDKEI